ncbi:TlpA family protein disulfide reductase [Chitinophaga alhagiae]|uniref:TlpA family protein disulfide reductase n=1 Tax=Chitinophaga alhagiae TaxID=2203219 RepID=UPI00130050C7|nr:TlpA disulfide reductase family protein [Chitinophaga alhagiae]
MLPALLIAGVSLAQQTPFTRYVETRVTKRYDNSHASAYVSLCELQLLEKLPDSTLRIRATLLNYRPGKGELPKNSTDIANIQMSSTEPVLQVLLLQQPVEFIYRPSGPAVPRPELEQLVERKAREAGVHETYINFVVEGSRSFLDKEVQSVFLPVPPGAARWFDRDSSLVFTAAGEAAGPRTITAAEYRPKSIPGQTLRFSHVYKWDSKAGGLLSASLIVNVGGTIDLNGEKRPVHYEDTALLRVMQKPDLAQLPAVTPALREMLIKSSPWSGELKDNRGVAYDSAKVMAFLKKMDPLFGNSTEYVNNKLSLIQGLSVEDRYQLYDSVLLTVPNHMLQGNSTHLHNKLQDVWGAHPDSAVQLIRYLGKARRKSMEDWLQHSFAQSVFEAFSAEEMEETKNEWRKDGLSEEKIAALQKEYFDRRRSATGLLQRLAQDKDTIIRQAAYPMLLGMQATRTGHADSLRLLAKAFGNLRPAERKYGNGSRYQLMLYKQMREKGMHTEAAATLKDVTAVLEKGTVDSLSSTRYADQNLLAYAYFLQYEALKDTHAEQALNYYARAAAVSPRNKEERAYDSFYDRAMLKSDESYRSGFANALFRQGDDREATKVLAQQVNANPAMLPDVQKAFEQHLPGRDFKDFVHNTLVRTWKTAPNFDLTGPDGKRYKLSDYRGKWLLIDFWGTWCAPCREELPEIQKMHQNLPVNGESAFLSIACHDRPAHVTNFMQLEKYTFPVAMSDGKVQGDYKVSGYPSKVIISPDGRMLDVAFNLDWKGAFRAFSQLRSAPVKPDEKNTQVESGLD